MTPRRADAPTGLQIFAKYRDDGSEQIDHRSLDQHGVHERSSDVMISSGHRTAACRIISIHL
ncbi:hypothetical protein DY468_23475 [Rhodopseudomonas sp. BR0M22]|nr:hypothetical protein [Rhodopseudomonas sp. BR0M22]